MYPEQFYVKEAYEHDFVLSYLLRMDVLIEGEDAETNVGHQQLLAHNDGTLRPKVCFFNVQTIIKTYAKSQAVKQLWRTHDRSDSKSPNSTKGGTISHFSDPMLWVA